MQAQPSRPHDGAGGESPRSRAFAVVLEQLGVPHPTYPITLTVADAVGNKVRLTWLSDMATHALLDRQMPGGVTQLSAVAEASAAPSAGQSPTLRDRLLAAARAEPVPAKALCRLVGTKYNGHSRAAIAALVGDRLLLRLPEGIALPEVPPGAAGASR